MNQQINVVNKLGGSCLRTVEDYQRVAHIIGEKPSILIVSASYGTTNQLLDSLQLASTNKNYTTKINNLIKKQIDLNKHLANDPQIEHDLNKDKEDILALLHSLSLLGSYSVQQHDWLLGYGEYWSSKIIASYLKKPWIDAGQIITINTHEELVSVDWKETKKRLKSAIEGFDENLLVMPGFVARTTMGIRALLGFNGSDFTAAIIAKLVKAKDFYKWTNVDGIYTADPKLVQLAFAIPHLSYEEAAELAYFGAAVLHPQSVQPAIEAKIPIHIKNFFKPDSPGTIISEKSNNKHTVVKGLSCVSNLALVNIEGTGLLGLCGIAERLFHALAKAEISVILISQAGSEHSISIVVRSVHGDKALEMIRHEFQFELVHGVIQNITTRHDCSVISAVGDGMSGTPGVAARFFAMLSKANINILAIAQGSSERNISAVINQNETQKALRVLHGGFYLSHKTLSIGLIGPGGVGSALLEQIHKYRLKLKRDINVDLKVRGIMKSNSMVLNEKNTELPDWKQSMISHSIPRDMDKFINHVASPEIPHAVIVDCTTSEEIANNYIYFLSHDCHIVTPNKKANSADLQSYKKIKTTAKAYNRHYLYETTVCAGLPVIKTIQDLLATGDRIKRIEGIVSGTLSYIFNQCAHGKSFAQSVYEAYDLGYTEPDPRDDLKGIDVARKFVCLAREIGYVLSMKDVSLLNLVPKPLNKVSIEEFLELLEQYQKPIEEKIHNVLKNNASLAYVGIIENNKISIELNGYATTHPFAHIKGTDNIILIQSTRYDKQPLIIQGPGAGKDVTAAGVFADLLKLASML